MIYLVLLILILNWYYSQNINKGWLIFAALITIIVELRGAPFDIITLALLIGLGKVGIDIFNAGK